MKYDHTYRLSELEQFGCFQITPWRVSAARRWLRKQCEKEPLFSEQIAAAQPKPEERVRQFLEGHRKDVIRRRRDLAAKWCQLRRELRAAPAEARKAFLDRWNNSKMPKTPYYGLDLLHNLNR